ncbi:hypothetical protein [Sulfuriferula thiophila]|uniref:hypothetical protein n=1 Tax=Sulfuriferula thiophila TaxID=1781211 RepID=UPI000F606E5F|nr:hypothetical protein [Sulfuriferula thiophila]
MYKTILSATLTAILLSACVVVPAQRGPQLAVAPALPVVVELGVEPYYFYSGYYYYYQNNRWSYSNARSGPWMDLPRNRYPQEVRFRNRDNGHDRDHGHEQHDRD